MADKMLLINETVNINSKTQNVHGLITYKVLKIPNKTSKDTVLHVEPAGRSRDVSHPPL